jgi:hypothetical protein
MHNPQSGPEPAFMYIPQFCVYAAHSRRTVYRVAEKVDGLLVKRGHRTLVCMEVAHRYLASLPRKSYGGRA